MSNTKIKVDGINLVIWIYDVFNFFYLIPFYLTIKPMLDKYLVKEESSIYVIDYIYIFYFFVKYTIKIRNVPLLFYGMLMEGLSWYNFERWGTNLGYFKDKGLRWNKMYRRRAINEIWPSCSIHFSIKLKQLHLSNEVFIKIKL